VRKILAGDFNLCPLIFFVVCCESRKRLDGGAKPPLFFVVCLDMPMDFDWPHVSSAIENVKLNVLIVERSLYSVFLQGKPNLLHNC